MPPTRIAIAGLGAIGRAVARRLDRDVPGTTLACVAARDRAKAQAWLDEEGLSCPVVPREDLIDLARQHGGRIMVPTGALIGLDAVAAAAEGEIRSVRMTTRKPPNGLAGAPHLVANKISVDGLNAAKLVFSGTAREAAKGFPANVNVVAALSLAGIGPDRTTIEIWADPAVERNCHSIEVDADSARFSMTIENVPSDNPKTGRIVALSVLAALRKLNAPLRVGT